MAAPTVGTYSNGTGGAGTSASASAPIDRRTGEPITAHLYVYAVRPTVPDPSGWSLINRTDASSLSIFSYVRPASLDSADDFRASGWSSTYCHAGILPYLGSDAGRPIDAVGDDNTDSSRTPLARGLTTTGTDRLLVWCCATDSPSTVTAPAGFTVHDRNNGVLVATATQAAAGASGDLAGAITVGASQPWAAHMFAVSPTGVVVPVTRRMLLLGVG